MRLRYVIPALLLIPLADAILLVFVAQEIGAAATVLLVVLTGLIGMLLVRAEGRHTLARIQQKAARGEPPTDELLDGALLIAAGAFLLTPGVVTDALGFLLTIPPTRYPIRVALKRFVVVPKLDEQTDGFVTGGVWTSGFPNDGDAGGNPFQGNGDSGPFGGGNAGPFDGTANDQSTDADEAGDVYDVGADEYRTKDDE
ncbi:phage T7 F exclusion suppressor FxsA [Halolamina pelagica]|uniref:Phage T7 F exclusion suppressor FxsA n=1 Tax=Halolamina pelagica TaxID=699431 RepID=A0A0P7G8W9_9EURY|nr:FxsA family protein [Halolamina pelagica]KPN29742.1 phage T7 F exclusion suppressor FxsA [Halolamina pelagica]